MAYVSVTNTFVNGAVGDANQMNTNFTDLVNGLSDGTKNLLVKTGSFASGVETPYLTATSAVVGAGLTAAYVSSVSGVYTNVTVNALSAGTSTMSKLTISGPVTAVTATLGNVTASNIVVTGDIYTTDWTSYGATSTYTGWASFTTQTIWYKIVGDMCFLYFDIFGISNSVDAYFTLPHTVSNGLHFVALGLDNGSDCLTVLSTTGYVLYAYKNTYGTPWTNSGQKAMKGHCWYRI